MKLLYLLLNLKKHSGRAADSCHGDISFISSLIDTLQLLFAVLSFLPTLNVFRWVLLS